MSSPCDPQHAPDGDVSAALFMIDSRLKEITDGKAELDPEHQRLVDQYTASLGPQGADDVLDGVCTLIFVFMTWLRKAHESQGKDVIEYVVPSLVATMRRMPKSVRPEAIPTMAGLVVAAGTDLTPTLWRKQYGDWTAEEMNPLEATAFLLAERINRITGDPNFAARLIAEALAGAEDDN